MITKYQAVICGSRYLFYFNFRYLTTIKYVKNKHLFILNE